MADPVLIVIVGAGRPLTATPELLRVGVAVRLIDTREADRKTLPN
jgi:hypothetical protein